MFCEAQKIKLKNFFAVSDTVADLGSAERKTICEHSTLSYNTASKVIESLLDIGLFTEKLCGKSYVYSLTDKQCFAVFDLTDGDPLFCLCSAGGIVLDQICLKQSGAYFYDESLSFFLKDMASYVSRKHRSRTVCGVCMILPDDVSQLYGTKAILKDKQRLERLVRSYFSACCICLHSAACASYITRSKEALIIRRSSGEIQCFRNGCEGVIPSALRTERSMVIGKGYTSVASLAREIAYAIGNTCQILKPDVILFDGEAVFLLPSFSREFMGALSEFTCLPADALPSVSYTDGRLSVLGAAASLRHKYIELRLKNVLGGLK